ncbi:MAG: class I tRNA ligase family protein [Mollicutes bacterium]|nr:MAG: class I tRNA ligase family protein [Mollicutes bacterium]
MLSINQDEEYVKFPFQSFYLVVAKKCLKHLSFIKQIDLKKCQFFKGTKLLKIQYSHPYLNFTSQIVHSEHVSMTEGTGAVHISPAHGTEDYDLAQKFKIPFQVALDEKGIFNNKSTDKDLIGKFYQTAQTIILDKLKKSNSLIQEKIIIHSYPHD